MFTMILSWSVIKMTKAFAKCKNCGYVIFTEHVAQLVTLVSGNEIYACSECHKPLDYVQLTLCSKGLGQDCETCEFRFQCFCLEPI